MGNVLESKRFKLSPEYSVISLDSLNYECLLEIFQYLPLSDLLQLRYFCRTLNDAVCEYLRTSDRKLAVFLTRLNCKSAINPKLNRTMLQHQSHFRWEDFTWLNTQRKSPAELAERKIRSLVLFVTTRMSHITKLALLVQHKHYNRFLPQLLLPVRALKVLFIDLAYYDVVRDFPVTEIVDTISGMTQLESLYYFRSHSADSNLYLTNQKPILLTNGQDFLKGMLQRLKLLHITRMRLPEKITCENLEELGIFLEGHWYNHFRFNFYPVLQTFTDTSNTGKVLSIQDLAFLGNIKVLKLETKFIVTTDTMETLNRLPNLIELHCRKVHTPNDIITVRNQTILRLFTEYAFRNRNGIYHWDEEEEVSISTEQKKDYVERCITYFLGLQMLKNQRPEVTMEL